MHEHGVLAAAACEGLRGVPAPAPPQRLLILLVAAAPVALCVGCYSAIGEGPAAYRTLSRHAGLYPSLLWGAVGVLFLMYMLDAGWWGHRGALGVARKALLHGVLWAMMGASLLAARDLPALPLSMLILLGVAFLVEARRHAPPLRELPIAVWGKALGRSMQLLSGALLLWWLLWISGCGDSGVGVDSGESGGCGSGSRLWGGALRASLVADLGCDLSVLAPGVNTAKSSCFAAYLMWASPFFCAVLLLVLSNVVLFSTLCVRSPQPRLALPRSLARE